MNEGMNEEMNERSYERKTAQTGPCPPIWQIDDFLKGVMKGKQPKRAPAHQFDKMMIS
jgi:hypothetical protein